jgi:hypothetical protein
MKYGIKTILAGLVMVMTLAPMARAEDADLSTPKKAGVSFAKAVTAGDMAAVKSMSTGSDADYALVKMISDLMVSMKNLEAASIKKFGADAKLPKEMAMDLAGDFASAEEKIDGDSATLTLKSKPDDKFPPTFKKDGNQWKMDLSNLTKDPATGTMSQMIPPMVKAMNTVAKNIGDDKYKTAAEAFTDMGAQVGAAIVVAPVEKPEAPAK